MKVVVIVTRGALNHLIQVMTLCMAATVAEAEVRVLFRDEAVISVTKTGAQHIRVSEPWRTQEAELRQQLRQQDLHDVPALLRVVKGHGDVRFVVCGSSLGLLGKSRADLLAEIDLVQGLTSFFIDEISTADRILTF